MNGMFNWKAVITGFIVTLILLPLLNDIAPIIGGIIVGYMVGGNYRNGIINSGFSVGLSALVYAIYIVLSDPGSLIAKGTSIHVAPELAIILTIILAIFGGLVLGLIGGIIGVTIKKKQYTKKILNSNCYLKPI